MIDRNEMRKLARARLRDAEVLASANRFDGATYLCGYSIELWLKSRICRTLKWAAFPETRREFELVGNFKIHDLDVLLRLSGIEEKIKTQYFAEWSVVAAWKPENRYNPIGSFSSADAQDMIQSAKTLLKVR